MDHRVSIKPTATGSSAWKNVKEEKSYMRDTPRQCFGSLLFVIYINDLPDILNREPYLFADVFKIRNDHYDKDALVHLPQQPGVTRGHDKKTSESIASQIGLLPCGTLCQVIWLMHLPLIHSKIDLMLSVTDNL